MEVTPVYIDYLFEARTAISEMIEEVALKGLFELESRLWFES